MDIKKFRHRQQMNPSLGNANTGEIWCGGPWVFAAEQSLPRALRKRSMAAAVGKQMWDLELASCLIAKLFLRVGETLTLQEQFS